MAPGKNSEFEQLQKRLTELEDQLRQAKHLAEQRFIAVEAAPAMIWMGGADAFCTYFNPAWLKFRGRALHQETGRGWTEGLHADDRDFCIETYLKAFDTHQHFRTEYRMLASDGEFHWIESCGSPLLSETDEFIGFIGSVSNIDARKNSRFTPDAESVRLVFSLTEREREVLMLVADGKSTRAIAMSLGITYKTADSHRSSILGKLGVHETASMVHYAIRAGLVAP